MRKIEPNAEDLRTPFVDTVVFAVTTNCNLRCTYCAVSLPDYRGEDFDLSRVEDLAESFSAAKVSLVQISGHGETTMISGWEALSRSFADRNIEVCITSNFSKVFSDAEVDTFARMSWITISVDTVDRKLLKQLRRKVDLRTILDNMAVIKSSARRLGLSPAFNWQCTLSGDVIFGLIDWFELGLANGVTVFTLGNLIEHPGLPNSPRHPARLDKDRLRAACDVLVNLANQIRSAGVSLVIQPGIIEGINESLGRYGINAPLVIQPAPPPKHRRLFARLRAAL